jgi:hypothetical protein
MGHAKRKEAPAGYLHRIERSAQVLDDSAVEQILKVRLGHDDGDPVSGIRNALVASAVFWAALALALIYLR